MIEPVAYRISQSDYLAFQRMLAARGILRFALFMGAIVGIVSLVGIAVDMPEMIVGAAIGWLIAVFGLPIIARYTVIPWRSAKVYREYALIQEEMTLALTDEGYSITQPSGHVVMPWKNVAIWNENEGLMAIYPTRQLAYILPKQALGKDRVAFIRQQLVDNGLPRKGKRRK